MGDTNVPIPINLDITLVSFKAFCLSLGLVFGGVFLRIKVKKKVPKREHNSVFSHKDNTYKSKSSNVLQNYCGRIFLGLSDVSCVNE